MTTKNTNIDPKKHCQFGNLLHSAPVAPMHRPPRKANLVGSHSLSPSPVHRKSKGSVVKNKIWNITELLDEVCREPDDSKHVKQPLPPIWLLGSRDKVETRAHAWHQQAKKSDGRSRLQSTSPALACIVVSLERELITLWPAYRDSVITHFVAEYGENRVVGAVEHEDEAHCHIHLYLVAKDDDAAGFGAVHPGYGASRAARKATPVDMKGRGKIILNAYKSAMIVWQDRLFTATGQKIGLERLGPRRRRMNRDEYFIMEEARKRALATADVLLGSAMDEAKVAKSEAEEIIKKAARDKSEAERIRVEVNKAMAHNILCAQAVQNEKERLAETPAGVQDAEIKLLKVLLALSKAETAAYAKLIDEQSFREKVVAANKARLNESFEHVDKHEPINVFDKSTDRATMRKPAPLGNE